MIFPPPRLINHPKCIALLRVIVVYSVTPTADETPLMRRFGSVDKLDTLVGLKEKTLAKKLG